MNGKYYYGTGRRKSSVARVFLQKGSGQIIVNGRPVDEFFSRETSLPSNFGAVWTAARMHITFMSVDGRMAQDINNVVGRYGKLNVKNCK